MKIICLSDTHSKHHLITSEYLNNSDNSIDTIIHGGDLTNRGNFGETFSFINWFSELPFKNKIFIAGNHDFWFERSLDSYIKNVLPDNIIYLNDSGVEIDGIKFWGSPVQPWFNNWAFNRVGSAIKQHWDMIPLDTNVLITHGPIKGYLDMTIDGKSVGCYYLKDRITELTDLKLHICGHIHEAYGHLTNENGLKIVNASVLNENYEMVNKPILIEI